jgi:hypothetical protein
MVLAEFGTTDDMVVIPYHHVWRSIFEQRITHFQEPFNTGGVDLAAGGDETVLTVRNGNKVIAIYGFRFDDTTKTVDNLEKLFREAKLNHPESRIFGDAGGLGKPMLDELRNRRGWHNIRYITNQSTAFNKRVYHNRGAELWFNFAHLIEGGEILLPNDERLKRQLSTRHYKQTAENRIQLESKLQARVKGHPSPDRGDATVLSFSNYRSKLIEGVVDEKDLPLPPKAKPGPPVPAFTLKEQVGRVSPKDEFSKYYGGEHAEDGRKNLVQLQELVKEHNNKIKERQLLNENTISG